MDLPFLRKDSTMRYTPDTAIGRVRHLQEQASLRPAWVSKMPKVFSADLSKGDPVRRFWQRVAPLEQIVVRAGIRVRIRSKVRRRLGWVPG